MQKQPKGVRFKSFYLDWFFLIDCWRCIYNDVLNAHGVADEMSWLQDQHAPVISGEKQTVHVFQCPPNI